MSRVRHCGFCCRIGHNIRNCTDAYGLSCCDHLHRRALFGIRTSSNIQLYFDFILTNVPLNIIRLFACRLNIPSSSVNKQTIIRFIRQYYMNNYNPSVISINNNTLTPTLTPTLTLTPTPTRINIPPICTINTSNNILHDFECPICYECVHNDFIVNTNCSHSFCSNCISTLFLSKSIFDNFMKCPMCRSDICQVFVSYSLYIKNDLFDV